jgi:hypothetical protein
MGFLALFEKRSGIKISKKGLLEPGFENVEKA